MNIDKAKMLREQLEDVFSRIDWNKVAGVTAKVGRGSYDGTSITFKVEFAEISKDGNVLTKEATAFTSMAQYTGFKAEDLGKTFVSQGRTFKIVGAKWHTKRPIHCEEQGNKKIYLFPAEAVRRALGYPPEAHRAL